MGMTARKRRRRRRRTIPTRTATTTASRRSRRRRTIPTRTATSTASRRRRRRRTKRSTVRRRRRRSIATIQTTTTARRNRRRATAMTTAMMTTESRGRRPNRRHRQIDLPSRVMLQEKKNDDVDNNTLHQGGGLPDVLLTFLLTGLSWQLQLSSSVHSAKGYGIPPQGVGFYPDVAQ